MPYSILTYPGDGVTTTWPINFTLGFISRDDVKCRVGAEVDGLNQPVYRTLTWISDGLVQVQGTPAAIGQNVEFTRTVAKDALVHDYQDGAPITESNLDDSNKQLMLLLHEILDDRLRVAPMNDWDMNGQRIVNLENGVSAQDAATVGQAALAISLTPQAVEAAADAELAKQAAEAAAETAQDILSDINSNFLATTGVVAQTGAIMSKDFFVLSSKTTPQVTFYGDSLTAGYGATNPPSYSVTMPTWNGQTITKNTVGLPGRTALYLSQTAWENLSSNFVPFGDMAMVVFHAGVNDIVVEGVSAAETFSRIARACRHWRQLGWRVGVCTLFSLKDHETARNTLNGYIRNNWKAFADFLVDLGANAVLGPDGSCTNSTYFQTDQVHLKDAGNVVVGTEMQTAITNYLAAQGGDAFKQSRVTTATSVPSATGGTGDATSLTLAPGEWDLTGVLQVLPNGSTVTLAMAGISSTSGNSLTGLQVGDNQLYMAVPSGAAFPAIVIPSYRVTITSPTTFYLKESVAYSGGTPQYQCRLSARKVP